MKKPVEQKVKSSVDKLFQVETNEPKESPSKPLVSGLAQGYGMGRALQVASKRQEFLNKEPEKVSVSGLKASKADNGKTVRRQPKLPFVSSGERFRRLPVRVGRYHDEKGCE